MACASVAGYWTVAVGRVRGLRRGEASVKPLVVRSTLWRGGYPWLRIPWTSGAGSVVGVRRPFRPDGRWSRRRADGPNASCVPFVGTRLQNLVVSHGGFDAIPPEVPAPGEYALGRDRCGAGDATPEERRAIVRHAFYSQLGAEIDQSHGSAFVWPGVHDLITIAITLHSVCQS